LVSRIVEEEETSLYEKAIKEINCGTYCFKAKDLFRSLLEVKANNNKKEYFLTDTIGILNKEKAPIEAFRVKDSDETIGVNTRKDLADAARILKNRILEDLMSCGVTVEDPLSTTIYPEVTIGQDSVIYSHTIIESGVEIGKLCHIGPFARIRPKVRIGDNVEIGNFVELVRTEVGDNTRIKHHTYLGDTTVGKNVNVGAGTITANFDGRKKNRTVIEEGAFVGVGAILIAPVKIGKNAVVGAGSVVPKNHNVPRGATVIGVPARILKRK
jgi:bifunctional UDP-N-acetylglucosamine pyrophosphorylase/glucosamine-1-phosphate N-acetyltransferase